jgi:hypothetical protein
MHLAETESVSIKCSYPHPAIFVAAVSSLETAKSIVLDLSAVATIRLLGIDDLLTSHEFVLPQDTALELRETLIDDKPERKGGTMLFRRFCNLLKQRVSSLARSDEIFKIS